MLIMRNIIYLYLIFGAWSMLLTPEGEISTIPVRVDGWVEKQSLINKILGRDIEMVVFNPKEESFEMMLRKHQDKDAIIIRSLTQVGNSFYFTDGSGTKDINLPAVEMLAADFDELIMKNLTMPVSLTFYELNPFIELDRSAVWIVMLTLYIIALIVLIGLIIYKLVKFGFFQECYTRNFNNKNIIVYIVLCIELLSTVIKFINGINLNDVNLLYHYMATRVLYTIHIPMFISSHFLWIYWLDYILKKSRKFEEINKTTNKIKIPFLVISIVLYVLEAITLIGTFTFAAKFPYWSIFVLGIYCLCAISVCIFYTVTYLRVIYTFKHHSGSERSKKMTRQLLILVSIFDFGICLWLVMLILQFVPMDIVPKRLTGLIGFYGIIIDSYALVWSFKNKYHKESNSTKPTNPGTVDKPDKSNFSTSSTLTMDQQ